MLIRHADSCLLIIDVQERLAPVVSQPRQVIDGCSRLLKGAGLLNVPAIVTEQYPKGLGESLFDIKDAASEQAIFFQKTSFSALSEDGFEEILSGLGKKQIIIAGVEEHICVFQTAIELKEKGYEVFVVTDACSSRVKDNEIIAQIRLKQEGVHLVSLEMVLFEWLRKAGTPEFKEVQKQLIR